MNLNECLSALGGNFDELMGRMLSEERIKKFLRMFPGDGSFAELCNAMENEDYATAFRAAHTLKGVCSNLGIENLRIKASEITEALRGNVNNGADALLPDVKAEYSTAIDAINQLD